jgi:hypothetical protein
MNLSARELPPPAAVIRDLRTGEVVRVWRGDNGVNFAINHVIQHDPILWGSVFATIAQRVARAYERSGRRSASDALRRIKEGVDDNLRSDPPPDRPWAGLLERLWRRYRG